MKFDELKSIAHNLSASLASGLSFLVGYYSSDVFREAKKSIDGSLEVDFLAGNITGGSVSEELLGAATVFRDVGLPKLCEKHGCDVGAFSILKTTYATDKVYGPYFIVTVADQSGKTSTDRYVGWQGKRA